MRTSPVSYTHLDVYKRQGFKTITAMVDAMVEEMGITVPVALHLDHGSYEGCKKCIEAGFSSIMFDGSHYPLSLIHISFEYHKIRTLFYAEIYKADCF